MGRKPKSAIEVSATRKRAAAASWGKDAKRPGAARGLKVTVMADQPRVEVGGGVELKGRKASPALVETETAHEPNSDRQRMVDHTLADMRLGAEQAKRLYPDDSRYHRMVDASVESAEAYTRELRYEPLEDA